MTSPVMMSTTIKKDIDSTIAKAVNGNKPISVKTYYLTDSSQDSLKSIISSILEKYDRLDLIDVCYNSVKGLVINATKANIKRALFKDIGLDINNTKDYSIGMEKINKHLTEKNFHKYKEKFKKHNLTVKTTFDFNPDILNVIVKNDFILLPYEQEKIREKLSSAQSIPMLVNSFTEAQEPIDQDALNSTSSKVVSLKQYKIDKQIFSLLSDENTNETIVKLEIPLNDKNIFNNEVFKIQMDSLFSDYKSKFDQIFHKSMNELDTKTSQIMEVFQNKSEESRRATDNLLEKIQKLGSNLYEEQQTLIASYGENVFKNIQDKLVKAKLDSDEAVSKVKEIGEEVFEINKKQIDAFNDSIDHKIAEQTTAFLDKHKKKLDEFNELLDKRIANQSSILQGQTNLYLDQMKSSNIDFVENSTKEIIQAKTDFTKVKTDIETELRRAMIMKQNLFNEMSSEKDSLKNSLSVMAEKVRKVEKFQVNMERIDDLLKNSEKSFTDMSSKLEEIKTKEEEINSFLKNTDLIEAARKNTEIEISMLDNQKTRIITIQKELEKTNQACLIVNKKTEFLSEKIKMVDSVESRINQMEKFGDEIGKRVTEISNFGKKLNVLSGSLNEQMKKSQSIEDQLSRFSKDVISLESKGNELNNFVSQVDQKIALFNSKSADLKMMESKFSKVEIMMTDLSMRHKQIVTMENRLNEIKEEMEALLTKAEDQMSVLNTATAENQATPKVTRGRKKAQPKFAGVLKDIKDRVLALHKKDMTTYQIADALNIDEEIISTILVKLPNS